MSKNARCWMPGNSGVRAASAIRCSRATAASWLECPKVNSRKKIGTVTLVSVGALEGSVG